MPVVTELADVEACTVGTPWACAMAEPASSMPAPHTPVCEAQYVSGGNGRDDCWRMALSWSGVSAELTDSISAATPVTWGVAIDVPSSPTYVSPPAVVVPLFDVDGTSAPRPVMVEPLPPPGALRVVPVPTLA